MIDQCRERLNGHGPRPLLALHHRGRGSVIRRIPVCGPLHIGADRDPLSVHHGAVREEGTVNMLNKPARKGGLISILQNSQSSSKFRERILNSYASPFFGSEALLFCITFHEPDLLEPSLARTPSCCSLIIIFPRVPLLIPTISDSSDRVHSGLIERYWSILAVSGFLSFNEC